MPIDHGPVQTKRALPEVNLNRLHRSYQLVEEPLVPMIPRAHNGQAEAWDAVMRYTVRQCSSVAAEIAKHSSHEQSRLHGWQP
jgi:hypothetical protein